MTTDTTFLMGWIGGKKFLRKTIAPLVPKDIKCYAEPFGGAGWVLFYKEKWADCEVYNDIDDRLVNLFRIVKYHPGAFLDEWQYLIQSRTMFEDFLKSEPVTDIQKAVRFYYLTKFSYGCKGEKFNKSRVGEKRHSGTITLYATFPRIEAIHKRLNGVLVEHEDFEALIKKYDFEGAFFYCDPPYTKGGGYKTTTCKAFGHERLKKVLEGIKGRFLLSYNNTPEIKEMYEGFEVLKTLLYDIFPLTLMILKC